MGQREACLLMGDVDQGPKAKCSDLDQMERPNDGKQKGWIMERQMKKGWRCE